MTSEDPTTPNPALPAAGPAVCICIPTRNRPEYLMQTLASVRAQTARGFRVLVSDDASEPGAAAQVEAHVEGLGEPHVTYCYHAENLKEYDHGRFLFGQCAEEFFAILHDDDAWEPSFLERCLEILRADESLACVTTDQFIIDGGGDRRPELTDAYRERMGRKLYSEGPIDILEPLLTHSVFALSCTVFRSAALRRSGLVDPELHGNTIFDINLFLRLGENRERAYYLPERLAAYRVHDDSLTVAEERGGLNVALLETFIPVLEKRKFTGRVERERRRHLAAAYHNYAIICYLRRDTAGLYRNLLKCLATNPGAWRNWAYLAFGLFPFLIRPVFGSRSAV